MRKSPGLTVALLIAASARAASLNQAAPSFALYDLHGKPKASSDYKGKVVFINFWASWCAPCQKELPELNALAKEYAGRNFALAAINVDEDSSKARDLLEKLGLALNAMDVLRDPDAKAVAAFDAQAMPSSFILDQDGIIRAVHTGYHPQDPQKWRKETDALLARGGGL